VPRPQRFKKGFTSLARDRSRRELPGQPDRRAHLLDVRPAAGTRAQVRFESTTFGRIEDVLEVVGDQFHEFLARHLITLHVHCPASRYRSSAARTRARARWSRTRWLVSLIERTPHTSADVIPS